MRWNISDFSNFQKLILDGCGIVYDESKRSFLKSCIEQRLHSLKLSDPFEYYQLLQRSEGQEELQELFNLITINETNYFRHPDHYKALREGIIAEIIQEKAQSGDPSQPSLSLWSAGCSSGDEAYSLAISLLNIPEASLAKRIEILGTDIDSNIIKQAKKAVYSKKSVQHLHLTDESYMPRYFHQSGTEYVLKREVADMVNFKVHNLAKEPYPMPSNGRWDIIFCRNVIIYFHLDMVGKVVKRLYDLLAEGGYLFLGYSESLQGIIDKFRLIRRGDIFVYKKETMLRRLAPPEPVRCLDNPPHRIVSANYVDTFRIATKLWQQQRFNEAMIFLKQYLEERPDCVEGRVLAARIYLELNDLSRAESEMEAVIAENPLSAGLYYLMGKINEKGSQYSDAVKYLKKALYLDSSFALAHFKLATVYEKLGKNELALKGFENAKTYLEKNNFTKPVEYADEISPELLRTECIKSIIRLSGKITSGGVC